jgi:mRNA-degrading endonuclease RelE of RelBE toxin-antitoxin system
MIIRETEDFKKDFKNLPSQVKQLFQKQKSIFEENWLDPRLHLKRIKELAGVYSFRVTRRYRVLFYFRNSEVIFFKIGHRKEIYRKYSQ